MSQIIDPRLGTTVGGYRIESLIGRGGMSMVYLAEDLHLGRRVALKLLAPELAQDEKFRERFVRESRLAASLEHPNIVTVYEARETDGLLYIAMRYVAGTDLRSLITREGPLDPDRTISIISQAASALDTAHAEGLIHRDVKPGNILITPRSESLPTDRVYLSDFGLTKRATSDSGITATGQFVGTLDYAAPEQFEGRPVDGRADTYSLGCVLYECLTGEVPFVRENQAALVFAHLMSAPAKATAKRPALPTAIDPVVARAMAKKPEDRYPTAGELAQAAADALGVKPVAPTTPTRPVLARRRRRAAAVAGAAVLAIVALTVGLVVATRGGSNGAPPPEAGAGLVDYLARVDPATRQMVARIPLGQNPIGVAVGEGSVWVLDEDGSVRRIDPVTNKVTVIKGVAQDPRGIAVGQGAVWVADGTKDVVRKIDPASDRATASIPTPGPARNVSIGDDAVWAVTGTSILRIDPSSGKASEVGGLLLPPSAPPPLLTDRSAISAAGGIVWAAISAYPKLGRYGVATSDFRLADLDVLPLAMVATESDVWLAVCGTPGSVVRLNPQTAKPEATISAGGAVCPYRTPGDPLAIAVDSNGVWVTDAVNGAISRIDQTTNQVDPPIRMGDTPTAIAVGLGSVWVTVNGKASPSPSTS